MTDVTGSPDYRKRKALCLGGLFFIFLAWGILTGLSDQEHAYHQTYNMWDYFFIPLACVTGLFWCRFDACEKNFYLSKRLSVLIVLIGLIGLPIYLIKTRGGAKGLISTILAFIFILFLSIISGIASEVVNWTSGNPI